LEVPIVTDVSNLTPAPVLVKPRAVVLLVEDNSVNMKVCPRDRGVAALYIDNTAQILMNHMKRAKEEYTTATNGLEALHKYQSEHQSIKVIFMGMKLLFSAVIHHFIKKNGIQVFQWTFVLLQGHSGHWKLSIVPVRDGKREFSEWSKHKLDNHN
jgi:hypothetical protein